MKTTILFIVFALSGCGSNHTGARAEEPKEAQPPAAIPAPLPVTTTPAPTPVPSPSTPFRCPAVAYTVDLLGSGIYVYRCEFAEAICFIHGSQGGISCAPKTQRIPWSEGQGHEREEGR